MWKCGSVWLLSKRILIATPSTHLMRLNATKHHLPFLNLRTHVFPYSGCCLRMKRCRLALRRMSLWLPLGAFPF